MVWDRMANARRAKCSSRTLDVGDRTSFVEKKQKNTAVARFRLLYLLPGSKQRRSPPTEEPR